MRLIAMNTPLKLKLLQPSLILLLMGLALCSFPNRLVAKANELPAQPTQQSPSAQPEKAPTEVSPQTGNKSPKDLPNQRKEDDRVYINQIYPEYCRMYFHRRDWVSVSEYQLGMQRCFYGNDRWF